MKNGIVMFLIIVIGCAVGWYIVRPKTFPQSGIFQKNILINSPTPQQGAYDPIAVPFIGQQSQQGETKGGIQSQNGSISEALISYKDDGFHESIMYIKLGSTVVFTNASSRDMWIASSPHPSHTAYPEFDQKKSVGPGGSYRFTFTKVGSWKFHNHMMPKETGTIVVRQ
jgi:plastocyanin